MATDPEKAVETNAEEVAEDDWGAAMAEQQAAEDTTEEAMTGVPQWQNSRQRIFCLAS